MRALVGAAPPAALGKFGRNRLVIGLPMQRTRSDSPQAYRGAAAGGRSGRLTKAPDLEERVRLNEGHPPVQITGRRASASSAASQWRVLGSGHLGRPDAASCHSDGFLDGKKRTIITAPVTGRDAPAKDGRHGCYLSL